MNSTSVHGLRALPDWSAVPSNSEDDRVLVNRRVAYFGAVFGLMSAVFYAYNGTLNSVLRPGWPFLKPEFLLHAAATAVCAGMWLLCRGGRRSSTTLNLIDVGGTVALLTFFGWMTVEEATGFDTAIAVRSGQSEALLMALITHARGQDRRGRHGRRVPSSACAPAPADRGEAAARQARALGAVGYYVLTGEPVFAGASVMEVCAHHLHSQPVPPSQRTERPVPAALESFLLACLAKDRERRRASAVAFVAALDALEGIAPWTVAHADQWWLERAPGLKASLSQRTPASTPGPRTVAVDLTRRAHVQADLAL